MSEIKLSLPRYDGNPSSDFQIWQARLFAILESKSLSHTIECDTTVTSTMDSPSSRSQQYHHTSSQTCEASDEDNRKAAAIIVNGLCDKPLRVVLNYRRDPRTMLNKLRERYASSSVSSRMSLLSELHALKYKGGDMPDYVDRYASLLDRLEAMSAQVPDELAIIMFMHSMNGWFHATIAALRTMSESSLKWDTVTARLIEEYHNNPRRGASSGHGASALVVHAPRAGTECTHCKRQGHTADRCWTNPANPNNRLGGRARRPANTHSRAGAASSVATPPSTNNTRHPRKGCAKGKQEADKFFMLNLVVQRDTQQTDILVDSGASAHMSPFRHLLHNVHSIPKREIKLGDNSVVTAQMAGDMCMRIPHGRRTYLTVVAKDVLCVPSLGLNLLSSACLASRGVATVFDRDGCTLVDRTDHDKVLAKAVLRDQLYWLEDTEIIPPEGSTSDERVATASETVDATNMWHRRLAHVDRNKIGDMMRKNYLPSVTAPRQQMCVDCTSGKHTRSKFSGHLTSAREPGEVIHSDVVGPITPSRGGMRYFVTFIDESTRFTTVCPMKAKSEVLECFKHFRVMFQTQYGHVIKSLHSDNGGEYSRIRHYARKRGIRISRSAPHTPQSNGIAERMNRTLVEAVRTTLRQSGLPKSFWAEALANAVMIRNRIPRDDGKSPVESLTGHRPSLDHIRPFGCAGMALLHESKRKKLDAKSRKCILLSAGDHKTYRLYDPSSDSIIISRHVVFDEDEFPAKKQASRVPDPRTRVSDGSDSEHEESAADADSASDGSESAPTVHDTVQSEPGQDENGPSSPRSHAPSDGSESEHDDDGEAGSIPRHTDSVVQSRYPVRSRKPPRQWWTSSTDRASVCHGVAQPSACDESCHSSVVTDDDIPTLRQALNSPQRELWMQAIAEEFESLRQAGTWDMVPRPDVHTRVFPSKFVLKVKRSSDGTIERYKARLVLLGNLQRPEVDYFETYAPVVDFAAVRIAIVIAMRTQMDIHHLDVKCAFLNGDLEEHIYMQLPTEFASGDNLVCKLRRSIYGLKQAPRAWNRKLTKDLSALGYVPFHHAECIFARNRDGVRVLLLIYVDDFLVMVSPRTAMQRVKDEISSLYEIKDLGIAQYFLGIKIHRRKDGSILLSQEQYVLSLLERFKMGLCKPVAQPMLPGLDYSPSSRDPQDTLSTPSFPYREAIGALLYLATRTRPDIAVAVSTLAKYVQSPQPVPHWEGVKRILRYLRGTASHGLEYSLDKQSAGLSLQVYTDADWAADCTDRYSRTGVLVLLGGNTVWWKSRKQNCIAVSSCEAEYMALFEGARDIVWLRNLLCEFGYCPGHSPTVMFHDNQGSISWASEGNFRRAKHVSLRYQFTNSLVEGGLVEIKYTPSNENLADLLTKPLRGALFASQCRRIGICP